MSRLFIGTILAEVIVALHCWPAFRLVFARSIRRYLPRVLLNLVLNALQAMQTTPPERRVVEIDAALAECRLHIQVADRAAGIPAALAEQVFALSAGRCLVSVDLCEMQPYNCRQTG